MTTGARTTSIAKATAIYILQALFWAWLAREALRDRPRGAHYGRPRSTAEWLWRFDAGATAAAAWSALMISTLFYAVWLIITLHG